MIVVFLGRFVNKIEQAINEADHRNQALAKVMSIQAITEFHFAVYSNALTNCTHIAEKALLS